MFQNLSKGAVFMVLVVQALIVAAIVCFTLPPFLWGPAPTEDSAVMMYREKLGTLVQIVAAIWMAVVSLIYYFCFVRNDSGRSSRGTKMRPDD